MNFAHGHVWWCGTAKLDSLVGSFVKNEIHGFWDVKVGKAYKCPQMNTINVLVHKIFWVVYVLHMAKIGGVARHS